MFSPVVAEVAKILDPQESKSYISNEGSEEGTVVVAVEECSRYDDQRIY